MIINLLNMFFFPFRIIYWVCCAQNIRVPFLEGMNLNLNPRWEEIYPPERTHVLSVSLLFNYIAMLKEIKTLSLFHVSSRFSHLESLSSLLYSHNDITDTTVRFDQCKGNGASQFCVKASHYK